ncbi:MAG: CBS domain-containing protein [Hyphomonadaceae bacterium]
MVHAISTEATLEEAARELHERKVGALVIFDDADTPVGVLSERDLIRVIATHGARGLGETVGQTMTRGVITAAPDESIDECLGRMTDRRIRHLPVLDHEGHILGVVSIGDLVKMRIMAAEAQAAAMQAYIATG